MDMSQQETIRLLHTCCADLQHTMEEMEEILLSVRHPQLHRCLAQCMQDHQILVEEVEAQLHRAGGEIPAPDPVMQGWTWLHINARLVWSPSGASAAGLLTDTCRSTIKTVARRKNQCPGADASARLLADAVIRTHQGLARDLKAYL